jgi:metal-responsive CopG/Arc/MetJ family transcriptional regulator
MAYEMPKRQGRRKVGRSPKILITLPDDLLARLDRMAFGDSRAEVIRQLIVAGLRTRRPKRKK